MKMSESIDKIAPALLKAQKRIGAAKKGADNPFFKSKYADLGSVMEVCKEILNEEGIIVIQAPSTTIDATGLTENLMTCTFMHESGQFVEGSMKLLVPKGNMQDLGSATTYARRYTLQSMAFINSEDDDGNRASGVKTTKDKATSKTPKKPDNAPSFSKKESRGF